MSKNHLKVFVFEDDPAVGKLLNLALSEQGYDVTVYKDPTTCNAYKSDTHSCPNDSACADIIITDHMMPKVTGIDFLLHQEKYGCRIERSHKAIITGAVLTHDEVDSINELGCKHFSKPFKINDLIDWIEGCSQ